MIPLSDDNPTVRLPLMTIVIIGAIAVMWLFVQGGGLDHRVLAMSVCNLGLVPAELTGAAPLGTAIPIARGLDCVVDAQTINWFTPVISLFMHGSWAHLLGNCLFLWVFGNNIEDVMGRGRFLAFYLICGLAAAAAHVFVAPGSPIPTVGASGAISGVMGAYLMLFPQVRVRMLFIFVIFFKIIPLPAWLVLLWWFGLQVIMGLPQLDPTADIQGGVAVWAHVGGFVAGATLIRLFTAPKLLAARRALLVNRA